MQLHHAFRTVCAGAAALALVPAAAVAQDRDERTNRSDQDVQMTTYQAEGFEHQWVLTGYAGPNFGDEIDNANATVGGALSYLHDGRFGAEVMANFTPKFDYVAADVGEPTVNNYMVNGIAALPVGDTGSVQPFVSGGLGVLTVRRDVEFDDPAIEPDDAQLGGNLGVGVMAFQDAWGLRTSLRYFTGFENEVDPGDEPLDLLDSRELLADTNFWQFDAGISYRW